MKEKKRVFLCKLPTVNYVILGIMCAVMIPFAVLGILRLAEVGDMFSFNRAFDIAAVVVELLLTLFIVLLTFLTRFVVGPKYFVIQRVVATKIPVERLLLIRHEVSEDMLVLYFADERAPEGVRFVVLRVFDKQKQDVVQAIREVNPSVSYEMFDNTRNTKDD